MKLSTFLKHMDLEGWAAEARAMEKEIERLTAENERLRAALNSICGQDTVIGRPIGMSRLKMIRVARRALRESGEDKT